MGRESRLNPTAQDRKTGHLKPKARGWSYVKCGKCGRFHRDGSRLKCDARFER